MTLNAINTLTPPIANPTDEIPYPNPTGTAGTLGERARAYLHTNCSQCHRPGGPTTTNMDLRYATALADTNACDVVPGLGDLGISDARLIAPVRRDRSVLPARMSLRDAAEGHAARRHQRAGRCRRRDADPRLGQLAHELQLKAAGA